MKRTILACFFGILFMLGSIGFRIKPDNIIRKLNRTITTEDGVQIYFDLFEPKQKSSSPKRAVIIGHGIIVSKEVMKLLAIELANAGFVTAALDFRGHGRSGGSINAVFDSFQRDHLERFEDPSLLFSFDILEPDIRAVKRALLQRGDVDGKNLGYVGYSMGGGAGFAQLKHDRDFTAMVGLAPLPDFREVTRFSPPNLLVLIARYDEIFAYETVSKLLETRVGISSRKIKPYHSYGSFLDRSAVRLYIDPYAEHFLAPWNWVFIRETRNWIIRTLGDTSDLPHYNAYPIMLLMLIIQLIGSIGFLLTCIGPAIHRFGRSAASQAVPNCIVESRSLSQHIKNSVIYIILYTFPVMPLAAPLIFLPMIFTTLEILLLLGPSIAVLLYLKRLFSDDSKGVMDIYKMTFRATCIPNIILGIGLGVLFYIFLAMSIGQIFSLVPSLSRAIWFPIIFLVVAFSLLNIGTLLHGILQEHICRADKSLKQVLKAGLLFYTLVLMATAFVLLVPCILLQHYFLLVASIPVLFILLPVVFLSAYIYSQTGDVVMPALVNSVFISGIFCNLSSMLWGPAFFIQ